MTVEQYHDIKHFVLVLYFYLCCEIAAISCAFHEFGIFIAGDGGGAGCYMVFVFLSNHHRICESINHFLIFFSVVVLFCIFSLMQASLGT